MAGARRRGLTGARPIGEDWERVQGEYRDLLYKSGFKVTRVVPAGRYSLIEATVA